MLVVINFADEKFRPWQQLQTQTAYHFGADKVWEYSPASIDREFYEKNKFILDQPRGAGYWLWKPYIILDALNKVDDGDVVFYLDSGIFFIDKISYLTNTMDTEKINIMIFGGDTRFLEKSWTKRDAFILMDCDEEKYINSGQCGSGYVLFRKCTESVEFVGEWLKYIQDPRIVTDMPNQLGKENYESFRENRHDQTILGLLAKKKGLKLFRNPDQFYVSFAFEGMSYDILRRSNYPQVVCTHRRSVGFSRTLEDFLRIYGRAPRLCEGIRSARFLLEEGLVKESYELLWRLFEKYGNENPKDWAGTWDDLLAVTSRHKEIGAPYAETYQPLLCKMFVKFLRHTQINLNQVPSLLSVAKCIENKTLIPLEFQDALIQLVVFYIEQIRKLNIIPWTILPKQLWEEYLQLNMPETPLKKYALEKMGGGTSNS